MNPAAPGAIAVAVRLSALALAAWGLCVPAMPASVQAAEPCGAPLAAEVSSPAGAVAEAWLELVEQEASASASPSLQSWLRAIVEASSLRARLELLFPFSPSAGAPLSSPLHESLSSLGGVAAHLGASDAAFEGELIERVVRALRGKLAMAAEEERTTSEAGEARRLSSGPVVKLADSGSAVALGDGRAVVLLLPDRRVEVRSTRGGLLASEKANGSGMVRLERLVDGGVSVTDDEGILSVSPEGRIAAKLSFPPGVTPLSGAVRLRGGRGWAFCGGVETPGSWSSEIRLFLLNEDGSVRTSAELDSGLPHPPFELPNGNLLVRYHAGVFHLFDAEGTLLSRLQRDDFEFRQVPVVLPGETPEDAVLVFHSYGGKYLFADSRGQAIASPRMTIASLSHAETLAAIPLPDGSVLLGGIAGVSDHLRRFTRRGQELFTGGVRTAGPIAGEPALVPRQTGAAPLQLVILTEPWGKQAPQSLGLYQVHDVQPRTGGLESTVPLPSDRVKVAPLLFLDGISGEPRLLVVTGDGEAVITSLTGVVSARLRPPYLPATTPIHLGGLSFLWQGGGGSGYGAAHEGPLVIDFDHAG